MNRRGFGTAFQDPDVLREMLEYYASGTGKALLGRRYGVDHTTIMYHIRKHGVKRGKYVELTLKTNKVLEEIADADEHLRQLENAPKPPKKTYKYQALFEEPVNPGKNYADYLREEEIKLAPIRAERMEKAKADKIERDRLIRQGKIPSYASESEHWNNTPVAVGA